MSSLADALLLDQDLVTYLSQSSSLRAEGENRVTWWGSVFRKSDKETTIPIVVTDLIHLEFIYIWEFLFFYEFPIRSTQHGIPYA